tara:strand:- start:65 stop:895 length:831 start_codon:yes stop_codon:yes gene_type:complete
MPNTPNIPEPKKRKYANKSKNKEHAKASVIQSFARKKINTMQKWVKSHRNKVIDANKIRVNLKNEVNNETKTSLINAWMFGNTLRDNNINVKINKLIDSHGSARNGTGYVYRSLLFSPNINVSMQEGTSIPHPHPSSWTLNPKMAVGWVDPRREGVVILRMKTASNVRKLFIGSYRPPININHYYTNPTNPDYQNQAEVIVASSNFIVRRVQSIPICVLTGVNKTGKNHKSLPNPMVYGEIRPALKLPGYTPEICSNNLAMPSILLVDVYPKPLIS